MQKYRRPVWAEINLNAIHANIKSIKSLLSSSIKFMAVVKANAYGHGLVPVARAAIDAGADRLGVAILDEAIVLRRAGISSPIQVLSETPPEAADILVDNNIIATVYSTKLATALSQAASKRNMSAKVDIKVDTGMHRAGIAVSDAVSFYEELKRQKNIEIAGIFTHFACADSPNNDFTAKQLELFLSLKPQLGGIPLWHAANSAATLFQPLTHLDMVRVGIAMYGLQPSTAAAAPVTLKPALSLKANIAYVRELQPGAGVSYALTFKTDKKIKIAVVPIGYGDGFSRLLSNRGQVLIQGRRADIIGNICMDQLLIKLPEGLDINLGEQVILIGGDKNMISAEEIASFLGTINYEVVCLLNQRVPRVYIR